MKHKRTLATEIPPEVKAIVWERDDHKCIFCKRYVPMFFANAHYIKRSQGGLGIPENIFTACDTCHKEEDAGKHTLKYRELAKKHLQNEYPNWDEEKLYYNKWGDTNDN